MRAGTVKVANLAEEMIVMQTVILALIETHPDPKRLLTVFNAMSANLQLKGIQDGKGRLDSEPLRKVLARYQDQIARKRS
jgi:hypothetical protein